MQQWSQDWQGSVFIPIRKKGNDKNVQNTAQLHSFHMLERKCSKYFKLGFNSMWTKKFQMYKQGLGKAEEPEVKLPISIGSLKKQESSRKTSTSVLQTTPKSLTVWIETNCGKFLEMGLPDHLICLLLRNLYAGQEATVRTRHGKRLVQNWERSTTKPYIVTLLI